MTPPSPCLRTCVARVRELPVGWSPTISSCPARWAGVIVPASRSPQLGAAVVVHELAEELELDDEEPLDDEPPDEEPPNEVLVSEAVGPACGVPESQAAAVVRASTASPARRTRAWRGGCSVTARTYPAGRAPTKPRRIRDESAPGARASLWQDRDMAIPVVLDVDTG